ERSKMRKERGTTPHPYHPAQSSPHSPPPVCPLRPCVHVSISLCFSFLCSSLPLSHTHTHPLSHTHSLSLSHTLRLSLALLCASLPLSHTHTPPLSHTHSPSLSHTLTLSLSLSHSPPSLSLSLS